MDLTQLANLGEFIGGVAVLVTLVYLAIQVRSNKTSTDFLSEQGVTGQFNQVNASLILSNEAARIFRRGVDNRQELDEDERVRFDLIVQSYMNVHHVVFDLGSKGMISRRLLDATKLEIAQYSELQGIRDAMEGRAFFYSPEFRALYGLSAPSRRPLGAPTENAS